MYFSGRRIKTPEQGLLAMYPFVDVLEGRSLFTATALDGVLCIQETIDAAPGEEAISPWSTLLIDQTGDAQDASADADDLGRLISQTTPGHIELKPETSQATFGDTQIGDTGESLFGNALHDRRGRFAQQALPTDQQIAEARTHRGDDEKPIFSTGRAFTGAMRPYLTMTAAQTDHVFA